MALVIVAILVGLCLGQLPDIPDPITIDYGFPLTKEQKVKCGALGFFDDPEDCCKYIRCDYQPFAMGHRVSCQAGTVWDSVNCVCTPPSPLIQCDPSLDCQDVPDFVVSTCPPLAPPLTEDDDYFDPEIPIQCCIAGIIFNVINETSFYLEGENPTLFTQTCPFGSFFNIEDCCCDTSYLRAASLDDLATKCRFFSFDDPDLAKDGVYGRVRREEPGLRGAGSLDLSAKHDSPEGSYARLGEFTNVGFGDEFSFATLMLLNGPTTSTFFHNGGPGGENATVSFEISQSEAGETRISGGAIAYDEARDVFYRANWNEGEEHFVAITYTKGEFAVYVDDQPPQFFHELDELNDDTVIQEIMIITLDDTLDAAERALFRAQDEIDFLLSNSIAVVPEDPISIAADCIQQIVDGLLATGGYINDARQGMTKFREDRRAFRRAYNKFCRLLDDSRDLENALRDVEESVDSLIFEISSITGYIDKICDIVDKKEIADFLGSLTKSDARTLKRKLKKLRAKLNDENPHGDTRFKLGSLEETFAEAQFKIDEFNARRRKRQQGDPEEEPLSPNLAIIPSKWPITYGEDFNGVLDELFVCNFAINETQILDIIDFGRNPRKELFT